MTKRKQPDRAEEPMTKPQSDAGQPVPTCVCGHLRAIHNIEPPYECLSGGFGASECECDGFTYAPKPPAALTADASAGTGIAEIVEACAHEATLKLSQAIDSDGEWYPNRLAAVDIIEEIFGKALEAHLASRVAAAEHQKDKEWCNALFNAGQPPHVLTSPEGGKTILDNLIAAARNETLASVKEKLCESCLQKL